MAEERRFENGRWWQWDGAQWVLEPSAPPSPAAEPEVEWDGNTNDPEYRAMLSQARAEQRRVTRAEAASSGRLGRLVGWLAVLGGVAVLIGGLVQQAQERDRAADQLTRAVRNLGRVPLPDTLDPAYPVGYAMVGAFLVLVGVIVIVGFRRRPSP